MPPRISKVGREVAVKQIVGKKQGSCWEGRGRIIVIVHAITIPSAPGSRYPIVYDDVVVDRPTVHLTRTALGVDGHASRVVENCVVRDGAGSAVCVARVLFLNPPTGRTAGNYVVSDRYRSAIGIDSVEAAVTTTTTTL